MLFTTFPDRPSRIADRRKRTQPKWSLQRRSLLTAAAGLAAPFLPRPPAEYGNLLAEETEKWGKVVRFAGIRPK